MISFKSQPFTTPAEVEAFVRRRATQSRYPFAVLNLAGLQGTPELAAKAREVAKQLTADRVKQVYVFEKDYPEMKAKLDMWLTRHVPKSGNDFIRRNTQTIQRFSRLTPENQERYLKQMSTFLNSPGMLKINQKIGYNYYISKLEGYLKDVPGETPSRLKLYLRKIIKSKYFYWIVLYKVVGIFVKVGVITYIFFFRKKAAPAAATTPESEFSGSDPRLSSGPWTAPMDRPGPVRDPSVDRLLRQ